jgi:hypothetical protein
MWKSCASSHILTCSEVKLFGIGGHSWISEMPDLKHYTGIIRIFSYTIPSIEQTCTFFKRRPQNFWLLCHTRERKKLEAVKYQVPEVRIALNSSMHARGCLIEPDLVYVGSPNFGWSEWQESLIGLKSKEAYDWYLKNCFEPFWNLSTELKLDVNKHKKFK